MFITALKTIMVEALNAGFGALTPDEIAEPDQSLDLVPKSVTINYPEAPVDWPAILVQFRLEEPVTYTGLDPDNPQMLVPSEAGPEGTFDWFNVRQGFFQGSIDFTVLALASEERDNLWDMLFNLILMNNVSPASTAFYDYINSADLIALTVSQGNVVPVGDVINQGVPWNPDEFTYEATVRINVVGEFLADQYSEKLYSLKQVNVYESIEPQIPPIIPPDSVYPANDGKWFKAVNGVWTSVS